MRAHLTLPGLTLLPQFGKALQSLGWGAQFPLRKRVHLLSQLQETNLGSPYSEKVLHGKDTITKEIT